ncbi:hypothetical protein Bp8pC_080 [Bacillus phage Bp8p-C]|uniref:Uncharacterized protein n=2 Tax=Agatevirus Bp8pC TaxID=1910937 RepID=A0A0A0PUP0_9CAUD|nr:hypothetical protein AXJ20_gp080 [Bacillus phage Bp8p-C]YP_009784381.1 hypothetical protein QLX39_gp080 [Bacillus phage Bp8p-T]AHJ87511.1 hypothetical protein Bp8pC_080 [Bacillus phage Bp8p-C]AHJ87722.1 hypothetical protein Bp8pT_080 [Bacillus phage Bp8p-T]
MRKPRMRAILKAKGCRRTSNSLFPRVYSNTKRVDGEIATIVQGGKIINLFWVPKASLRQHYREVAKASTKRKIGDSRLLKKRVARQMVYLLVSEDSVERCQLRVKNHIYENTEEAANKLSQLNNKERLNK